MKKHTVFNGSFYRDMLRQLRLTGIAFSIICVVISVLVPIAFYLSRRPAQYGLITSFSEINFITPILWGFMYAGGALLVYNAFSFLNKRSASDFYHSMPNTALATWTSTAAAVVTWIVGIVFGTVTITMAAYSLFAPPIDWSMYPYLLGYFTIGTLLVASAAMVAVAVTGTTVTNLSLTALILFWPRILLFMITSAMESRLVIVPMDQFGLFNMAYHIPIGIFSSSNPILFTGAYWYSGILAALLFAAAALLYRARRSETAEKSAPSRLLQHVYRSAAVLPLVIAPTVLAVASRQSIFSYVRDNPETTLLLWGVALVAYYVYELATTKKIKHLLSITPMFLVLSLISSLVVWIGAVTFSERELNRLPDVSSLEQVQSNFYFEDNRSYGAILAGQEPIYDPAILAKFYENLERNIQQVKDDTILNAYHTFFNATFVFENESLTRMLYLSEADTQQIFTLLQKDPDYRKKLRTLPEDKYVDSVHVQVMGFGTPFYDLESIWKILKAELAALDDDAFYALVNTSVSHNTPIITVSGRVNDMRFYDQYPLTSATPKALSAYLEAANAASGDLYEQFYDLTQAGELNSPYMELSASFINIPSLSHLQIFISHDVYKIGPDDVFSSIDFGEFFSMVPKEVPDTIDLSAPTVQVTFRFEHKSVFSDGTVYLPLSEEQVNAFIAKFR